MYNVQNDASLIILLYAIEPERIVRLIKFKYMLWEISYIKITRLFILKGSCR